MFLGHASELMMLRWVCNYRQVLLITSLLSLAEEGLYCALKGPCYFPLVSGHSKAAVFYFYLCLWIDILLLVQHEGALYWYPWQSKCVLT